VISYRKKLTANDIGLTGGHQAGICIPRKNEALLSFFPTLDAETINPEVWLYCEDESGKTWRMRYIYYNGKLHANSTRNEYRITYMTKLFRQWNAKEGDTIVFTATDQARYYKIKLERSNPDLANDVGIPGLIVLRGWSKVC
jgi:hypothetical protein